MLKERLLIFMSSYKRPNKGHMGSTIKFSSDEDKKLFLNDFNSKSLMIDNFGSWSYKGNYDIMTYKFQESIVKELIYKKFINEDLFIQHGGVLEKLHLCLNNDKKNLDVSEQNEISISFYETSSKLKELYIKFIKEVISHNFNEKVFYQQVPTFRFHFPNQSGYDWKDRYHTDIMLGHPPYEINIWLPFTNVYGSNSMRLTPFEKSIIYYQQCNYNFELFAEEVQYNEVFSKKLKDDSFSLEMDYGKYIMFDPRCLHCTQHNTTQDTRISMDIRIITEKNLKKYSRTYKTTGRKKTLFQPGHYFSNECA